MDEMRTIKLPKPLCEAIERKFSPRFVSVEDFLTAAMKEFLREDVAKIDEQEERVIEERLKALGYV